MFSLGKKTRYHSFFKVRNIISIFQDDDDTPNKNFKEADIAVEVEPVDYEMQSPSQARMIERLKRQGFDIKEYIPTGYKKI